MKNKKIILITCKICIMFQLTFEGLWSRHTHPKDYPDDNWQTRFSDVIGASHTIDYRYIYSYYFMETAFITAISTASIFVQLCFLS